MKILELEQLEIIEGGAHADCSEGEGAVAGAFAIGWVLGPIGYAIALAIAINYWTTKCGISDYQ